MNIDPSTTKYLICASITADGIVEKPDVVGAIFGQTEGLIGDELDLRDLQKSGRMGRIEVELQSRKGKSEGTISMPSSLDQVETAIIASALETIDRVGPCKARIETQKVEDVRAAKKMKIVERAKILLKKMMHESKDSGIDLTESVRQAVQVEEIIQYGPDKCPAGPNVETSDAIIIVEGRSDVLNLLKYGIKNAIGVEGTNIPKTIQELSSERVVTAFVDGDRGGELILRELLQVSETDFVARAPKNREVEELTQKQIIKALRNKIPAEQFFDMMGIDSGRDKGKSSRNHYDRRDRSDRGRKHYSKSKKDRRRGGDKRLSSDQMKYRDKLSSLSGTLKALLMNKQGNVIRELAVRELADTLKKAPREVNTVVFDGVITQRLLDIVAEKKIKTLVGVKFGNVTKHPSNIRVYTKKDLE